MEQSWTSVVCCIIVIIEVSQCQSANLSFPDNFKIGTSSAAYQIEGAWNVSDKGVSVWDWFTHTYPELVADGTNGDDACNSYYKYQEDVEWIKDLGLDHYRFSINWPRILPNGFSNNVSKDGIQYYKNLIQALLDNDIEPIVTIYHWDHPKLFEDMGGWTNELMVDWFADYARVIFEELGPMVKTFVTINEPATYCTFAYNETRIAPGKVLGNIGHYLCVHNILKAHATAWHIYNDEYRSTQQGQIGIASHCRGWVPGNETTEESIEQYFQFDCGWVMHPLYYGDYPEIMKTRIDMISELEGLSFSRLPKFSEDWIQYINGTSDFFGLNHYTSVIPVFDANEENGVYSLDSGVISVTDESWPTTSTPRIFVVPAGFRHLLRMIKKQYNNPPVFIFENGYPGSDELIDTNRISYHHDYLTELLKAVNEDGCNVLKYTIWTLMDNYQWTDGHTVRFGIISVDLNDANKTRTAKQSTTWWRDVIRTRELQDVPTTTNQR